MTTLTADDLYLFNEGRHFRLYEQLGAHLDGDGVRFAVWAPNARRGLAWSATSTAGARVQTRSNRSASSGIWTGRVPGWRPGDGYKFAIESRQGGYGSTRPIRSRSRRRSPPRTASIVADLDYEWRDDGWMQQRGARQRLDAPMSIYEVHLGSWRATRRRVACSRTASSRRSSPTTCSETGFTHVELLPIMEHPFYGSWGYQTTGYFAPTSRYGTPKDFMAFVDELHDAGIGVILDWVPSHFPTDEHGLALLRRHAPLRARRPAPGLPPRLEHAHLQLRPQRGARRSSSSSACFWLDRYHVDGLRVDAVASMLYLDYSRKAGEWIPNEYGGRENLEAIRFLRELNEEVYRAFPDVQTFAEESTAWPMVSRPTYVGGLGFGFKWDMGWMHDTLRTSRASRCTAATTTTSSRSARVYAFTENFVLPLSHDEVVHGKGSLRRQDARRRVAAARQPAPAARVPVGAAGQEAAVHGRRDRPVARVGPRAAASTGICSTTPTHAGVKRWSAT